MNLLPSTVITTGLSATTTTPTFLSGTPRNITIQANFTYGSGGTSVDVYAQTSLDSGLTWTDVCNFHFTTASARKGVNLSTTTPAGSPAGATGETTPISLVDGSLSSNTAQDGILGPRWRIKYQSSGTYAGGTTVSCDIQSADIPAYP